MSVSCLVKSYLDEKAPAWAPLSHVGARRRLQHLLVFFENRELTRQNVLDYVRSIHAKRTPQGQPWKPRTSLGVLIAAQGFLKWALLRGYILEDLFSLIPHPRIEPLPRALQEADVVRLIEQGPRGPCALRDRAILEALYGTGLRAAELRKLEADDVDLTSGFVYVRQGKGRKDRIVPLGERATQAIRAYLRHERPRALGPLFLTQDGRPLSRNAVGDILTRASRRAGLHSLASPHQLRHSYATHLVKNGADVRHVQALLGHARLSSTEVYTRVDVSDLQRMIEKSHPREREGPRVQ